MRSHLRSKHNLNLPEDEMEVFISSLQAMREDHDHSELAPFSDESSGAPPAVEGYLSCPSPHMAPARSPNANTSCGTFELQVHNICRYIFVMTIGNLA